jgi:hypothetical protein
LHTTELKRGQAIISGASLRRAKRGPAKEATGFKTF